MRITASQFEQLTHAVREAGALARRAQGKVVNEGKTFVSTEPESERLRAMHTAKTVIDEQVQELILRTAATCFDSGALRIDAEEDTPSLSLFTTRSDAATTLVIDPIDGTLEYLELSDHYSICVGVIEDACISYSFVFFPALDVAYVLTPGHASYRYTAFSTPAHQKSTVVVLPPDPKRVIYTSRNIAPALVERITAAGFEVIEMDAYSHGLLKVLDGDAAGWLGSDPQTRDVLLGPVIGHAAQGFMCDTHGQDIRWPASGRVDGVFFGNAAYQEELTALFT